MLDRSLCGAPSPHGCAHACLYARDSGLYAAPRLPARSCWLSISGRAWGYPLPGARNPSPSFAFQCAPELCAPRPCACVSATVRLHTSIADMHMDDNMLKAMGAAIAAAMAQVLNNTNNDNSSNQGTLQAPARGAHDAVAAADGAQPPPPVRNARAASRGRGAAAQALMVLQCAQAPGGVQPGQAPVLSYSGVQCCQAPTLTRARTQSS